MSERRSEKPRLGHDHDHAEKERETSRELATPALTRLDSREFRSSGANNRGIRCFSTGVETSKLFTRQLHLNGTLSIEENGKTFL